MLLALAGVVVGSVLVNLWLVRSDIWGGVHDGARGLVHPTLLGAGALLLAVLMVLPGHGGLRLPDLGWRAGALPTGVLHTAVLWVSVQIVLASYAMVSGTTFAIDARWTAALSPAGRRSGR